MSAIKKIAILRANALGDLIFVLPALQALRETYPKAEITLLATPWHKEFLSKRPTAINRVIVIPPSKGVRDDAKESSQNELKKFFKSMQEEHFDVACQLHGGGKYSNPFLLQLGARLTIGLKTPDAPALDRWIPYIYYQNEYARYLEVVSLINATTNHFQPVLSVTPFDMQEVRERLPALKKSYAIIHPGASDPRRRWETKKFAEIANFLFEKGYKVVITGTTNEKDLMDSVASQMSYPSINACNTLSINGLAGLIKDASYIISNDTGPLHLAEALGTRSIGIYWCGNMINGAPFSRTKQRTAISWITHCPLCGMDCAAVFPFEPKNSSCQHLTSFVSTISVEEVEKLLDQMIQEKNITINSQQFISL